MLERELEVLSERVVRLERRHRRLRLVGMALVVGMAALVLGGQARTEERTVIAERFVLVDSGKKVRAGLRVTRDGAVSLILLDAEENTRAVLGLRSDGSPLLTLSDKEGEVHTLLTVRADKRPGLFFLGKDDKVLWKAP
ncbi:MAG TPA: hypothetical protein VIG69_08440 [Candidatus Methylomirabilis sp.]|jgi:hypothetical protein